MGSITSNNFETRAGSGTVTISHPSITGGQNFEVSGIDSVKADFDLEETSSEAQNVYFKLGEFGFRAFDRMSDGNSLFGTLDALSATDQVTLDFNFTTNAGRSIADRYKFTIEDMEYDREKRETTIEGAVQITADLQTDIASFFTNYISTTEDETFNTGTQTFQCVDAKTFVENALPLFNSSNSTQFYSGNFNVNGKTASNAFVVVNDGFASETNVDELLFEMAAAEGAVIGSLMGYNFFVARDNSSSGSTTLNEDNVKKLNIDPGLDIYAGIDVNFEGVSSNYSQWTSRSRKTALNEPLDATETGVDVVSASGLAAGDVILVEQELMYIESISTNTLTVIRGYKSEASSHPNGANVQDTFNPNAGKTLSVTFRNNVMAWATWDSTNSEYDDVGGVTNNTAISGRDAYAGAYGANKARKIKLTILGIDTLKPYQSFTLDTSFPSLVRNQTFRPSALTYDFDKDVVEVEAYKI